MTLFSRVFPAAIFLPALLLVGCLSSPSRQGGSLPAAGGYPAMREHLRALVQAHDPRAAFTAVRQALDRDAGVAHFCHALLHETGRAALEKEGDVAHALRFHEPLCNGGYVHGVIEAAFREGQILSADLRSLCDSVSSQELRIECVHGTGHGAMLARRNDLDPALAFCADYPDAAEREACVGGVFMELFNAELQMHPSPLLRAEDPFQPCPAVSAPLRPSCYLYAPMYYLTLHPGDYVGALSWCEGAPDEAHRFICAHAVGGLAMNDHPGDPSLVQGICGGAIPPRREACLRGMARMALMNAD